MRETARWLMVWNWVGLAVFGVVSGEVGGVASERPNVVLILADDLGWSDLGCQGSGYYETPRIDGMAARGMRFTQGYTAGPNCQPSRAALMSGMYGARTGVYTVGGTGRFDTRSRPLVPVENVEALAPEVVTVAEELRGAGYATGLFGKWHLGGGVSAPAAQGFGEAITSQGKHFGFDTTPPVEVPEGTYLADFLTDRAVDFLERHKGERFFLCLHHFGVHAPHEAKPELVERFAKKPGVGGHFSPVYAAMIASVDESVGRVLDTLERLGLSEQTLVIFTSDNGGVGGYRGAGVSVAGITDNAPLRGGKGMLYEGGIRVPYLFFWPGVVRSGVVCEAPIHGVDLLPTLLELAGMAGSSDQPRDGVSYASLLRGGKSKLDREALFWHFPGYLGSGPAVWRTTPVSVIRRGDWKLMHFLEDDHLELYNLREDVGERVERSRGEPARTRELKQALDAWRGAVGARMPQLRGEADGGDERGAAQAKRARRRVGAGATTGKGKRDPD